MDSQINPWAVQNVDEFLYYCCPECDERNKSKEMFLKHAKNDHEKSKDHLQNLDLSIKENFDEMNFVDIPMTFKTEFEDDSTNINENTG